jgi:hypothetical protein
VDRDTGCDFRPFSFAGIFIGKAAVRYGTDDVVMVEIPVTPEAAEALGDLERRERIGKLVSSMLRPQSPGDDPLAAIFASIKSAARRGVDRRGDRGGTRRL